MDIDLLLKPALKILDVSQYGGEGAYVTLKLFPYEKQNSIEMAKTKGMKISNILEIQAEYPDIEWDNQESIAQGLKKYPGISIKLMEGNPDYDNGYSYMLMCLEYGVDEKEHNFMMAGKAIKFNKKFWELLANTPGGRPLFKFIADEVVKYQAELSLGESTGKL